MKVATVVGARPQFIKAALMSKTLRRRNEEILIHTGQHYDSQLSDVFFRELGIPTPDYQLGVGSDTHARQTAKMLEKIEEVLLQTKPELLLVYGDTNSTIAASLAAAKLSLPIVHVEAGLRSFNRSMPEEINRIVTDHLSSVLFCPTDAAVLNLKQEGIKKHVHQVGDIMYDTLLQYRKIALQQSDVLRLLNLSPRSYCVATIHRSENTDSAVHMKHILTALANLGKTVVLPLHPRTASSIRHWQLQPLLSAANLKVCPPLSYLDMLNLVQHAETVLTDSGGLQKEAYMLQIPCITLRQETEWVETVTAGWNTLAKPDMASIIQAYRNLKLPSQSPSIFGDGNSASIMCGHMESFIRNL